jgi:hypothetical protein
MHPNKSAKTSAERGVQKPKPVRTRTSNGELPHELGLGERLSREGEIALIKRIDASYELMLGALSEWPLTLEALDVWCNELKTDQISVGEITDLEIAQASRHGLAPRRATARTFGNEGNSLPSVTEATLKLQVLETLDKIATLYKKLGRLQDASVNATIASDEFSVRKVRRFKKLQAEIIGLIKKLNLNSHRIEALVDGIYGINTRLDSRESELLRLAEAYGIDRVDFLKQYFGNELDPNWFGRVGQLSGPGWQKFVQKEFKAIEQHFDEMRTLAKEMRLPISSFRRIVRNVQIGEREFRNATNEMIEANFHQSAIVQGDEPIDGHRTKVQLLEHLKQDPLGARALVSGSEFVLVLSTEDRLPEDESVTEQFRNEALRKIGILQAMVIPLCNQRGWKDLPETVDLLQAELARSVGEFAKRSLTLWSLSVSLASFLEQSRGARGGQASYIDSLEPEVERALSDLIVTVAPFIRTFDTPRKFDSELVDFNAPPSAIEAAHEITTLSRDRGVLRRTDADIISVALGRQTTDGPQSRKAHGFGYKSITNFVGSMFLFILGGGLKKLGEKVAEKVVSNTDLADRAADLILESQKEISEIYEAAPPDMREAARELMATIRDRKREK